MARGKKRRQARPAQHARRRVTVNRTGALGDAIGDARTIVYVHGIGNKPIQSILKCQWDDALFGFDLGERSRLAYWVNREYYPDPSDGTCRTGDLVSLEDAPTGRAVNLAAHLAAVSLREEVAEVNANPRQQRILLKLARALESTGAAPAATVRASRVGAKVLPLPVVLRRWITRKITRAFIRDSNDFFFDRDRRARMRESLLERLRVGGGPFVVIAHSQGSMIAYDVLSSRDAKDVDISLLVTIGSPLGITEVQDQLKALTGQRRLGVPPGVRRWVNVADPLDPVAFDKGLAREFHPVGFVDDDVAWNLDSPRHPHSGTGYLRTKAVQDSVRERVDSGLFQPVADFAIARDLSRQLENCRPQERHKVLIELVEPAQAAGLALETMVDRVVTEIRRTTTASEAELRLERLRHFVAVDLTREETEALAATTRVTDPAVRRIWRNAQKRALLEVSVHTVQALPAHTGYQALGRNISWAILDTGIQPAHPHFERFKNIGPQFDCTRTGPLKNGGGALDENGHGTHVAGIIAGHHVMKTNGVERIFSGMAPQARLHIYKVLDKQGNGEDAWIIKALDHIAQTNEDAGRPVIQGVNLSLGGPFDQSVYGCGHSPLCKELRRLWRQGVVVVLAAGNEGFAVLQTLDGTVDANMDLSIGDPANLQEAIAVGSVHKANPHTYGVSYFSSRGPTADGRQKPDVVAPGERVLSCRHRMPKTVRTPEDLYVEMSGTSMAAPHVSGILAAFLSLRREFIGEPDRVRQILLDNCTDLRRDRPQQGAGLPNLVKMLVNT